MQRLAYLCLFVLLSTTGCRWNSIGQNTLGVQLFQQGRYAEALQQFDKAKIADPTNPDAYYNLAATYHKLGVGQNDQAMVQQSESLYNQCLDLSPNHVDCHRGLAVLLVESGRQDSAFTLLKNWASQNPTLADARVELSRLYQEFGETKVAEQHLDDALALNPNSPIAWAAKGRMREVEGDLNQALQNYQQSLALNSLQPELYQRIAALNVRLAEASMQNIASGNASSVTSQAPNSNTPRY